MVKFGLETDLEKGGMTLGGQFALPIRSVQTDHNESLSLRVVDGALALVWDSEKTVLKVLDGTPGECLQDFIRLYDSMDDPDRVLSFARRYGVLRICEHYSSPGYAPEKCDACQAKLTAGNTERIEPIVGWVAGANVLRSTLRTMARWQSGDPLDPIDTGLILPEVLPGNKSDLATFTRLSFAAWTYLFAAQESGGLTFSLCVNVDSEMGNSPALAIRDFRLMSPSFALVGLPAILFLQMTTDLSSSGGCYICSQCHQPYGLAYEPSSEFRKPWRSGDRRNFCSDACRRKARNGDQRTRWLATHSPKRRSKYRATELTHVSPSKDSA